MRIGAMIAVALLADIRLYAGEAKETADLRVPVYMDYQGGASPGAVAVSKAIASRMFHKAGVAIVWVNSKSCPPQGVRISLTGNTPAILNPGGLAYAMPYEGTHIRVFLDRIEAAKPDLAPHLLAHVLVHEIIHILEGCARHSERGMMKAHWDGKDFSQMLWTDLPIAQEDIDLIHLAVEQRARLAGARTSQDSQSKNPGPTVVTAEASAVQ